MRVVHLWHHIGLGGIETFLCPLLNELKRMGLDVTWAYRYFNDPTAEAVIRGTGVPLYHLSGTWNPYPFRLLAYLRHLRRLKADLIHVHAPVGTAAVAAWLTQPRGLILHHHAAERLPPARPTARWLYRLHAPIIRSADLVLACSDAAAAEICGIFHVRPPRTRGFHSGIDLTPYEREMFTPPHPALVRQAGEVILLFVGRLVRSKGLDVALDALSCLRPSLNWRFVVVGGGAELGSLQEQANRLGLANRVTFTGRLEDIVSVLTCADVFVHPSRYEGLGLSIVEAMAAGLPVVSTNVGGIPEVVTHEGSGILVPVEDWRGLAASLARLIESPDLRARMGAVGKQRAADEFDIRKVARRLASLYDEVLATTTSP